LADSRIEELRRRIERDPGSRLFAQLAEEHRKAGELGEAIRVARAGLVAHPVYASARLTLGRALLDSGDADGARQELELALRQAPDNILASRFLGQALEQQGDREAALRQFAATLRMAPGDEQLAAHVRDLEGKTRAADAMAQAPTGPLPRALPPPLPSGMPAAGGGQGAVPPTVRLAPSISPAEPAESASREAARGPAPVPGAGPASAVPVAAAPAAVAPAVGRSDELDGTTLPPGPGRLPAVTARPAELDASEAGQGTAPFSSSTLAELYLRQGLQERAAEVYRQVLAEDPGNARARAGLAALAREESGGEADRPGDRRAVLERQIAGLEAMLASVRRK
jgi:tetratricopeptide (TPR) repeat protein